jgi:hypothetical protein
MWALACLGFMCLLGSEKIVARSRQEKSSQSDQNLKYDIFNFYRFRSDWPWLFLDLFTVFSNSASVSRALILLGVNFRLFSLKNTPSVSGLLRLMALKHSRTGQLKSLLFRISRINKETAVCCYFMLQAFQAFPVAMFVLFLLTHPTQLTNQFLKRLW